MALLAFALVAILLPPQTRGPVPDDDGKGVVPRSLTQQRCPTPKSADEIVVCKRDEPGRYRIGPACRPRRGPARSPPPFACPAAAKCVPRRSSTTPASPPSPPPW